MNIPELRREFPVLGREIDGRPLIYLDSAATSLKPRTVVEAERRYATEFTANIHRGKHILSEEASAAFDAARRRIASFLGVPARSVIFVHGATEGINAVARGIGLSRTDKVLLPVGEHHSNILPWMREASVAWLDVEPDAHLTPDRVAAELAAVRPKVLSFAFASNVTGVVQPAAEICAIARSMGVMTCVDASQVVAHLRVDVASIGCDFLTFSGHKCLGPTGIGVLTGTEAALNSLEPLMLGGGCVDRVTRDGFALKALPERLEAGTPNISGVLGLAAAIDFLEGVGFDTIEEHQAELADALSSILAPLRDRRLMSLARPRVALGCVTMPHSSVSADDIAESLSLTHGIMVRSGFHCAHPLFDRLGRTNGALRASASIYNTIDELAAFGEALRSTVRLYGL